MEWGESGHEGRGGREGGAGAQGGGGRAQGGGGYGRLGGGGGVINAATNHGSRPQARPRKPARECAPHPRPVGNAPPLPNAPPLNSDRNLPNLPRDPYHQQCNPQRLILQRLRSEPHT